MPLVLADDQLAFLRRTGPPKKHPGQTPEQALNYAVLGSMAACQFDGLDALPSEEAARAALVVQLQPGRRGPGE